MYIILIRYEEIKGFTIYNSLSPTDVDIVKYRIFFNLCLGDIKMSHVY